MRSRIARDGDLPPYQQAIRAKCVHPSGAFVEFAKTEIEQSIPARFEQMVRRYPDRVAVKTKTQTISYEELNTAANRIAHAILTAGGHAPAPVALLFEKGIPLIASILGALKAGKFYVLMDPSLPEARLAFMLADSRASLLLVTNDQRALAAALAPQGPRLLDVGALDAGRSLENPALPSGPGTLAYLAYTSGSTGQPKGVIQTHRNFLHAMRIYTNDFHICIHDRVLMLGTRSGSLFRGLLNGASVYPLDIQKEGLAELTNCMRQEEITMYHSVPSVFRQFVDTLTHERSFPKLRLITLLGESVSKRDVELYQKHFSLPGILVNILGTTETEDICRYFLDHDTQITDSLVPVGYTIEDKTVLMLSDEGKVVDDDEVGEIAVESPFLSFGYWQRPDLTRAAFQPTVGQKEPRVYRTGDLGIMRPDGCLVHLGRKDFQVKIRGQRVEIAEIEMALLDLETVQEAVVVAREDVPGHQRLVAYVVPARHPGPSVSVLRSALARTLPDYMIPSAFVMMSALPAVRTGKVDRRMLPAPGNARPALETPFLGPRTPVEEMLATIWAEVLELKQVGIHDDFLELGGDSLLAHQLISRVLTSFRVTLSVPTLFQAPTVADMAVVIVQHWAEEVGEEELAGLFAEVENLSSESAQQQS